MVNYPNVECKRHDSAPGYAVCKHVVLDGKPVGDVELAEPGELGQILCEDDTAEHSDRKNYFLVCASCADAKGWLPPS